MLRGKAHALVGVLLAVWAGLVGALVAAIVTMNVHIVVGLEQGYAASLSEVVAYSPLLLAFDLLLLVGAVVTAAGATALWWWRGRRGRP